VAKEGLDVDADLLAADADPRVTEAGEPGDECQLSSVWIMS
jgi:hypothetical protein